MDLRIRPANDNELSTNRRERSYRVASNNIITTGVSERALSYKFNHVYFEEAQQDEVFDRVYSKFVNTRMTLFLCYG
jgi:hypothetical protein